MYYPVFSYQGSLRINGVELRDLSPESRRQHLSGWTNPQLPAATLREMYYWRARTPASRNFMPRLTPHG
ncbi:hypothetical protein JRY29_21725 [Salmonella enterica subsp. enterica serovar Kentucky]|nr:hypothetical protein JRY29_21725 [Salmonella enterica subsp. enterica serovar Kentucky]